MGGKEEVVLFDPEIRRKANRRKPSVVAVVFIVAIVVLASMSMLLGGLAQHYHDSKYRSQYWQVVSLSNAISFSQSGIAGSVDPNATIGERYGSGIYAQSNLVEAEDLSYSIQLMYPDGSEESVTLLSVHATMRNAELMMWRINDRLDDWLMYNTTYEFNATVLSSVSKVLDLMHDLANLVYDGVDQNRDFIDHPYSLVKRMNLSEITNVCSQTDDICREILT